MYMRAMLAVHVVRVIKQVNFAITFAYNIKYLACACHIITYDKYYIFDQFISIPCMEINLKIAADNHH